MRWKYREEWNPLNCAQGNNHEHYGMLYRYLLLLFTLNHQSHAYLLWVKIFNKLIDDSYWWLLTNDEELGTHENKTQKKKQKKNEKSWFDMSANVCKDSYHVNITLTDFHWIQRQKNIFIIHFFLASLSQVQSITRAREISGACVIEAMWTPALNPLVQHLLSLILRIQEPLSNVELLRSLISLWSWVSRAAKFNFHIKQRSGNLHDFLLPLLGS